MKVHDLQFVFIGNNAAIDFMNTEIVSRGELVDLLNDEADLAQWAELAGMRLSNRISADDLREALAFRQAMKDVFLAQIDHLAPPRHALTLINRYLASHITPQSLRYIKSDQSFELIPANSARTLPMLLASLADAGAQLLASPQADRLKRCSNSNCVLIFVDTSRGQKRRWCSMDTCGNRAKVATHYRNTHYH